MACRRCGIGDLALGPPPALFAPPLLKRRRLEFGDGDRLELELESERDVLRTQMMFVGCMKVLVCERKPKKEMNKGIFNRKNKGGASIVLNVDVPGAAV